MIQVLQCEFCESFVCNNKQENSAGLCKKKKQLTYSWDYCEDYKQKDISCELTYSWSFDQDKREYVINVVDTYTLKDRLYNQQNSFSARANKYD